MPIQQAKNKPSLDAFNYNLTHILCLNSSNNSGSTASSKASELLSDPMQY